MNPTPRVGFSRSGQMNPVSHRWDTVLVCQEEHVPPRGRYVPVSGNLRVEGVGGNQSERYIYKSLRSVEGMSGETGPDQVDPLHLGRLRRLYDDLRVVLDLLRRVLNHRPRFFLEEVRRAEDFEAHLFQ